MRIAIGVATLAAAHLWAAMAYADGCEPIVAAQIKGLGLPTRSTMVVVNGGITVPVMEIVAGNGRSYSRQGGETWRAEALPENNEANVRKNWSGDDCSAQGNEIIDGDTADVFLSHNGGPMPIDLRMWVSRSTGLVIKSELRSRDRVMLTTFDYRNVQIPPDGAKGN